jgi:polar amino acid transport system substrate-binding protein
MVFTIEATISLFKLTRIFSLVFVLMAFNGSAFAAESNVVRITTGEWVPYVSKAYKHYGGLGQLVEEIYKRAGLKVQITFFPWVRGHQVLKDGLWNAGMPYYCSQARLKVFYCSDPIMNGKLVFFHRTRFHFEWKTMQDLKDLNVGATLGYFYGKPFEKAEKEGIFHVFRLPDDKANFENLMRGRTQLFPQDELVGNAMIRNIFPKSDWDKITHSSKPLHTRSLHLVFPRINKRSEKLLAIFNKGLQEMRASGELEGYLKAMRSGVYERGGEYKPKPQP